MIAGKSVMALITARGGSKGLPRKNIAELGGKPLIAWSIEAAQQSRFVDRTVLSSDDDDIIAVAKEFGCEVPFRRPAELAADHVATDPVIVHALEHVSQRFDYIVLLQPTSPLRLASDIDGCLALCEERGAPASISVSPVKPVEWMYRVDKIGALQPVVSGVVASQRQQLPQTWAINGAVYVAQVDWYLRNRTFLTPDTLAWQMPSERSIDIDTEIDLIVARALCAAVRAAEAK